MALSPHTTIVRGLVYIASSHAKAQRAHPLPFPRQEAFSGKRWPPRPPFAYELRVFFRWPSASLHSRNPFASSRFWIYPGTGGLPRIQRARSPFSIFSRAYTRFTRAPSSEGGERRSLVRPMKRRCPRANGASNRKRHGLLTDRVSARRRRERKAGSDKTMRLGGGQIAEPTPSTTSLPGVYICPHTSPLFITHCAVSQIPDSRCTNYAFD